MSVTQGGDMAMAPSSCNTVTQNCGTGQKCIPKLNPATMAVSGTCVADGTITEGMTCVADMSNANLVMDNCKAGLTCDNDGPGNAWKCRKFCAADSGCTGGQKCADVLGAGTWGWCLPPCTPFGTDCPNGDSCAVGMLDVTNPDGNTGFFVCKTPGAGTAFGASCAADLDCGPNLVCDTTNNWCTPICDTTHACTMKAPTDASGIQTCMPFTGLAGGGGVCN
jgi:hypothetical protein